MNFMYQVMTNGIGGVNVGGVEGGYRYGDDNEVKVNAKVYSILLENRAINVALGYLTVIRSVTMRYSRAQEKMVPSTRLEHKLTAKAVDESNFIIKAYEKRKGVDNG